MSPIEQRLVVPFYLDMMGTNSARNADPLWDELVRAGREASVVDVKRLLAPDSWRPVVMGAWFSLQLDRDQIGADLESAIAICRGTLTAPPLAVAAATVIGRDAAPILTEYIERDLHRQHGAATFVAAVVEELGFETVVSPEDRDRRNLASMLDVASRLRVDLGAAEN